jgi:DNA-directed RNA polymerase subunit omega
LGQFVRPLVDQVDSNKPLSIALEEIAREKIVVQYPGDALRAAEEMLAGDEVVEHRVVNLDDAVDEPDA